LIESSVGSEGQHTQKDAGLGLSSEFTFPLQVRGQRAVDRLAELRDWSIGSIALGDTFGPNPGSFRGRSAKHKQDLLENYYRISTHLESTRKQALRLEKPDQAAVRSLLGAIAQAAGCPIHKLTAKDGLGGGQPQQKESYTQFIESLGSGISVVRKSID
jgi:hypothetical protein